MDAGSKLKRTLLILIGSLSLGVGIVGVFVPVLPTTVFLLMTAACWVKGSPRMHDWLMNSRFPGRYLRNYRNEKGITRTDRIVTLTLLWLGIGSSAIFAVQAVWLRVLLTVIAIGVTIHVASLKRIHPRKDGYGGAESPDRARTGGIRVEHDTGEFEQSAGVADP